jgi:hypothetical protein
MKKLVCTSCGGSEWVEEAETRECAFCKTVYEKEKAVEKEPPSPLTPTYTSPLYATQPTWTPASSVSYLSHASTVFWRPSSDVEGISRSPDAITSAYSRERTTEGGLRGAFKKIGELF